MQSIIFFPSSSVSAVRWSDLFSPPPPCFFPRPSPPRPSLHRHLFKIKICPPLPSLHSETRTVLLFTLLFFHAALFLSLSPHAKYDTACTVRFLADFFSTAKQWEIRCLCALCPIPTGASGGSCEKKKYHPSVWLTYIARKMKYDNVGIFSSK